MDMHSGGGMKEKPYEHIYIEASEDAAKVIFYNRFGHNPERVSCTCCGEDYSISEEDSLEQASAYDRHCEYAYFFKDDGKRAKGEHKYDHAKESWCIAGRPVEGMYVEEQDQSRMDIRRTCNTKDSDPWGLYQTVDEYVKRPNVLVIRASEIRDDERKGQVPEQGYVWRD
jgi:hypothetical protein